MGLYDTVECVVASILLTSAFIYLGLNLEDECSLKVAYFLSNQFDIILYNRTTCSLTIIDSITKISGFLKGTKACPG